MITAKLELLDSPSAEQLAQMALYTEALLKSIEFDPCYTAEDDSVKIHFDTQRDAKTFLRRLIADYETMGYEIEQEVSLFEMSVFVNDPELQAFFQCQRMNLNMASNEALAEIIAETSRDASDALDQLERMDAMATLNGLSHMREILNVIVNKLDDKGISIGDSINQVAQQTIH